MNTLGMILSATILTMSALASSRSLAANLPNLKIGTYSESSWVASAYNGRANTVPAQFERYSISMQGSQIVFTDQKLKISYPLDLNSSAEQELPSLYIEQLQKNPLNGGIGQIINKITISEIKQVSKNEIKAKVKIYVGYRSAFGGINATITLGARAATSSCNQYVAVQTTKADEDPFQSVAKPCIKVAAATSAGLTSFTSDVPGIDSNLNAFGAFGDLALRLLAPTLTRTTTLHEI